MGDIVRPDHALSIPIMLELIQLVDSDWTKARPPKQLKLAMEGTFYTLAYTLALRGEEVPLIKHMDCDLTGIRASIMNVPMWLSLYLGASKTR